MMTDVQPPQATEPTQPPKVDNRPWFKKKRWWAVIVFALFVLGRSAGDDAEPAKEAGTPVATTAAAGVTETTAATSAPPKANPYGTYPADEAAFIQAAATGQNAARTAENDLQKGAAKATRDAAMCAALRTKNVSNWTGKLTTVDANGEGKGVLTVEIAEGIEVKTWNNAFSDVMDATLIDPSSPVFTSALALKEGQTVKFSGTLLAQERECLKETSLTLNGKLTSPSFLIRLSAISPA